MSEEKPTEFACGLVIDRPQESKFEEWLPKYMAFRNEAASTLARPLPSETAQLQHESQILEPMKFEAERHRAKAISFYYQAKVRWMEHYQAQEWPRSALQDVIKASSHKELWAREDAEGLCRVVDSRGFKVSQHLKMLQVQP